MDIKERQRYDDYAPDYLEDKAYDDDFMMGVREALRGLPLPEQRIFVIYMENRTYTSVAKELKCSVPTAATYIKRIRTKLLDKIKKETV